MDNAEPLALPFMLNNVDGEEETSGADVPCKTVPDDGVEENTGRDVP